MKRDLSFNIGLKKTNAVYFNVGSDKKISLCCTMINIPEEENLKILNDSIFARKQYKKFKLSSEVLYFKKHNKNSYICDDVFIKKYSKEFYNSNSVVNLAAPKRNKLKIYNKGIFAYIENKNAIDLNKPLFVYKSDIREIYLYKIEHAFKKLIETNNLNSQDKNAYRGRITIQNIDDVIERLKKSIRYHSFNVENKQLTISVNSKAITSELKNIFLNINNRPIYYLLNFFIGRDNRPLYCLNDQFDLNIRNKEFNKKSNYYFISKDNHHLKNENEEYCIKKTMKDLRTQDEGLFIDKSRSHLQNSYKEYFISKEMKYLKRQYEDYFVSKDIIHVFRQYKDFYANKRYNPGKRDYLNTTVKKSNKGIREETANVSAKLDGKDIYLNEKDCFISLEGKDVYINEYKECRVNKKSKEIRIDDFLRLKSDNKGIYTEDILNVIIDNHELNILNNIFLRKDNFSINKEKDILSIKSYTKPIFTDDDIITLKTEYNADIYNDEISISRDNKDINCKREEEFIYKKEHKSEISKNTDQPKVDYIVKNVHVNAFKDKKSFRDNYEFVSVINCYDDFEENVDNGQIDELLLPHKDYNYTSFLKELINDDGSIKAQYVTGYDKNTMTYTVKLPVENPIEVYEYIGRDYIDLDVGFLKYFITLLESRWKSNIYRYAAMYAVDALTDIMEFLYDFFEKKYAKKEKQMKMAKRCMQLFRWYSEMAILNNCDYELEFATKKISVDYANKNLNDFNNMTILNNMAISKNYILEPIDKKLPSSITFVNIHKQKIPKLALYFKLYNCNSDSSILITDNSNNATETVYKPGIYELNLELENKITIQYEPTDMNQSIAISSASISNYPTRNFTVRYKGRLGDVNPILKDLFNKLLLVTQKEKEQAKDIAPVTAAIYRMIEYFELHHTDKVKGKRLTIKK